MTIQKISEGAYFVPCYSEQTITSFYGGPGTNMVVAGLDTMVRDAVYAPPVAPDDARQVGGTEDPRVLEWENLQKEIKEKGTLTLEEVKARYGL